MDKKIDTDTAFQRLHVNANAFKMTSRVKQLDIMDPAWALYFSVVVEHASLSRAAEALSVSPSTVSRKLDELESSIGVRLFDRDTRNLRLTEAGDTYLHYVRKALNALDDGRQVMDRYGSDMRGQLRVWCPQSLARHYLADIVIAFSTQYPDLQMTLKMQEESFSLNNSDFDVGICVGMPLEDRAVVSKLCSYQNGYVATPTFFQKYGMPETIQDLVRLPIVKLAHDHAMQPEIVLSSADGNSISAQAQLIVNDAALNIHAILSGQFVGRVMYWECLDHLKQGNLQRTLPELSDEKTLYILMPSRKGNPLKVQLFVDFLKARLMPQLLRGEQLGAAYAHTSNVQR